jgi:hypothetical protein
MPHPYMYHLVILGVLVDSTDGIDGIHGIHGIILGLSIMAGVTHMTDGTMVGEILTEDGIMLSVTEILFTTETTSMEMDGEMDGTTEDGTMAVGIIMTTVIITDTMEVDMVVQQLHLLKGKEEIRTIELLNQIESLA